MSKCDQSAHVWGCEGCECCEARAFVCQRCRMRVVKVVKPVKVNNPAGLRSVSAAFVKALYLRRVLPRGMVGVVRGKTPFNSAILHIHRHQTSCPRVCRNGGAHSETTCKRLRSTLLTATIRPHYRHFSQHRRLGQAFCCPSESPRLWQLARWVSW